MLHHRVIGSDARRTQDEITPLVNRTFPLGRLKRDFAGLSKLGYTESSRKADGGMWLTPQGVDRAERLRLMQTRQ
jgi:hypothetical protein